MGNFLNTINSRLLLSNSHMYDSEKVNRLTFLHILITLKNGWVTAFDIFNNNTDYAHNFYVHISNINNLCVIV